MKISTVSLETCGEATGMVVVIDVLRAFSTATYALAAGAEEIWLVSTVEEALDLRKHTPNSLAMGEVDGLPIPGFDFSNSPAQFDELDLTGRRMIQRTSAGTQGVVRSTGADILLAGSFTCAGATARYIRQHAPPAVTFVITGILQNRDGDEDAACADYLTALLTGASPPIQPYIERVHNSSSGRLFVDPDHPGLPSTDIPYCTAVDRFDFAMPVERRPDGLLVMRAVRP